MVEIYYRVLQTDGKPLKALRSYYDGIVLEAHIVEQYTNFAVSLVSTINKPFFIDPTVKLVLPNLINTLVEKEWFLKLVEAYNLSKCLQNETVMIDELRKNLDEFVKSVIEYQRSRIAQSSGGLELFGISGTHSRPEIILQPYFIIDDIDSEIYELNLEILDKALAVKGNDKLYAVIAMDKHLLSPNKRRKLISDFAKADGFCVWVVDFRENDEDERSLKRYIEFFKELSETKKPIVNMYGGAFSIFLGKLGLLNRVVQGLGYGEHRSPYITTTGSYPKRYYIPKIYRMVPISDAQELIREVPDLECKCEFCKEMNILNTSERYIKTDYLKMHYIVSKWNEKQMTINDILENLGKVIAVLDEKDLLDIYWDYLHHLKTWYTVLQDFVNRNF